MGNAVAATWSTVWGHRELLRNLTTQNIRTRYRQTRLGILWAVADPAALILIYVLAFGFALRIRDQENFPLFISVGVIHYNMWSALITAGTQVIVGNASTLSQINFPRSLLPLSAAGATLYAHLYAVLAFLVIGPWIGFIPWWGTLVYIPVLALSVLMATGVAFAFAAINVFFRDLGELVKIALRLGFFATPVLYDFSNLSLRWQGIMAKLPFAPFVTSLRDVLYSNQLPSIENWILMAAWASFAAIVGVVIFHRTRLSFAEWL